MVDTYIDFASLSAVEKEDVDFKIFAKDVDSSILIAAPHGGGIEQGTSEIALSISDGIHKCYCFEGIKAKENYKILHITSTNFDEPKCIAMCQNSNTVVTIHGTKDNNEKIFIGGLHIPLKSAIITKLCSEGFNAVDDTTGHSGQDIRNLCNKGITNKGVQIEISKGLRKKMFKGLNRGGRKYTTNIFHDFVNVLRSIL